MNHPYELLADLLDGTLDEGDLAGVQAHLDCLPRLPRRRRARDRGTRGRSVAPPGRRPARSCTSASSSRLAAAAGSGGQEAPGQGTPAWYRWAGVAAAAAVVVAIAIALPNVGGGESSGAARRTPRDRWQRGEQAEDAGSRRARSSVEDENYDAKELEQLARAAGRTLRPRSRSRRARRTGRSRRRPVREPGVRASSRPAG